MGLLAIRKQSITSVFLVVLVIINLLFVFLQIYKQTQLVKLSYRKQRIEKEQSELNKYRNELVHKLHLQQSSKAVKQYATGKLGMRNTNVAQIHKIVT